MQQAFRSGQNFHKRAEIDNLLDGAAVNFSNLGFFRQPFHHGHRTGGCLGIGGGNGDGSVIFHINRHTGLTDNLTDVLAAGTNNGAHLIFLDLHRRDTGRILRNVASRRSQRLTNLTDDVHASLSGLSQRLAQNILGQAVNLDVHLHGGYALFRTAYLEVHITGMIFIAQNVGQNNDLIAFLEEPHGNARHDIFHGHPTVHQA